MGKLKDRHINDLNTAKNVSIAKKRMQWARDLDNIEKLATDTLRAATLAEQQFFFDGEEKYSQKFFEQVTLPLHQIIAFLRDGEETNNG